MRIIRDPEDGPRREKLAAIFEHVGDIAEKISAMEDPLPEQLEKSIPGYLNILRTHTHRLKSNRCSMVVAGESSKDKSFLINALLGQQLLPYYQHSKTSVITEISYDRDCRAQIHFWDESLEHVVLHDSDQFHLDLAKFVQAAESELGEWPYKRAEVYLPQDSLRDGLTIVDVPNIGAKGSVDDLVVEQLFDCAVLLYTLSYNQQGVVQVNKLQQLLNLIPRKSPSGQHFFNANSTVFVCCVPAQLQIDGDLRQRSINKLKETLPNCDASQIYFLHNTGSPGTLELQPEYEKLLDCVSKLASISLDSRVHFAFSWLQTFVSRVLHHLRAFLSQSEKTQEERLTTFAEISLRLQQLTFQADEFFSKLQREVDGKVDQALGLIRNHLSDEDVATRLATWTEDEAPDDQIWHEVDMAIRERISCKLYIELSRWEEDTKFFQNMRPQLIHSFQQQFVGIEKQLTMVETMIARHDSRLCLLDVSEHLRDDDIDHGLGFLPYNLHLNLGQKIALGVAAPFLVPIALTIAVLGLPILGGMAAKDLIIEKLAENKLKEYNADRLKYLQKRTREEMKKFVKSKALTRYVQSHLQPAYRCIAQLEEVVPGQIEADRAHVESLRDDARETKDFVRFYQPLVEIFEFDKQMLTLFKVMSTHREKLDIRFPSVTLPQSPRVICRGLKATIQGDFWVDYCRGKSTRVVSLRRLNHKLDPSTVDDYLQEEEAYRFQANPHFVRFYGVTKHDSHIFHLVEPLSCSLRHFLAGAPEVAAEVSDKSKFTFLKNKMIEVVRGLDYLHDRGWVHYDLSLDTVAVDASANIKLTNISSRCMVKVDRRISCLEICRYAHLPHEVLVDPPAAYTSASEMYAAGIMMWEMWTGAQAYREEILDTDQGLDSLDKFVAYIETNRPKLCAFYTAEKQITTNYAEMWLNRLQQCWAESERLSSKAWLQLMDEMRVGETLPFKEHHFGKE